MSVMTTVLDGAVRPAVRTPRRKPRPVTPVTPVAAALVTAAPVEPVAEPAPVEPVAEPAPVELIATVDQPLIAKWVVATPGPAERAVGALAHLSGAVVSVAGPLLLARLARGRSEYVREQAMAAANFQLAFLAALAPLLLVGFLTLGIAALLIVPLVLAWGVTTLLAALASVGGERYRYPVALRVVR
jgi:uncharacterized Tic20 family protein